MRKVTLKVFTSNWNASEAFVFKAPRGRRFTETGAADLVMRFLGQLSEKYPEISFRVVTIGAGEYNVIPESTAHA